MIITLMLNTLASLITWFCSIRPAWSWTLPTSVTDMLTSMLAWSNLLPIPEMITCLGISVTLWVALTGIKWAKTIVDWVVGLLP